MHLLGIDVGTSGCKAVAFDKDGHQVAEAYREYPLLTPQEGWAELDSALVMERCFEVIRDVASKVTDIRGLGISSQGEAFTPVAADGTLLANGMTSSDMRAVELARSFPETFGAERLYQITGHTAHPMFSLFKLLWLRDHAPEVWNNTAKFLCYEDLLEQHLGLEPAMGWPMAGRTMLFDVSQHTWSDEILEATGLTSSQLARPLASGTIAGTIPDDIARSLGLPAGVQVVTGGHDQPCGALGAGITEAGLAMYATGTVECITPAFEQAVFSPALREANLCTYDHTAPGRYATVAFSLTGGNILKWVRDEFGEAEVKAAEANGQSPYELLLAQLGDEPAKPMVLPYFTPSGTPYFDTDVAGTVVGLRLSTSRGQFIRALLEGVALEMRLNLDILEQAGCPIRELRAIGGGSRSPLWNQLKADVIGKPLTTLDVSEAGCLGTAMLACAAVTEEPLEELAARWVRPVMQVQPRDSVREWYETRFAQYRDLYPTLKKLSFYAD